MLLSKEILETLKPAGKKAMDTFIQAMKSLQTGIIAIDEFQQISKYKEDNVEALLRTHIQHCNNAQFIFAGSQNHVMGNTLSTAPEKRNQDSTPD